MALALTKPQTGPIIAAFVACTELGLFIIAPCWCAHNDFPCCIPCGPVLQSHIFVVAVVGFNHLLFG